MDFSEEISKFEVGSEERIFFEKVLEKLGPSFVRKSVEERKREAHNSLNNALKKYFESYILANAITRSAEQLEIIQEKTDSSSSSIPPIYLNLVQEYLQPESSGKLKLFGLSQENTSQAVENNNSKLEISNLKKLVEDNINDFCIKLIKSFGKTVLPGENWKNVFDKTIKDLEYKAALLANEETKQWSKKQLREKIKSYYEELHRGISLMNKLITLHSEKLEFELDLAKFYFHKCQALLLKVKVFELKMLEATYNEETIPALKLISSQLDKTEQKLKEEQNEKTVALEQYLKLGEEYGRFVDEYSCLIKKIREEQWAIDELKSKNKQHDVS